MVLFLKLMIAHALADFALQNSDMARLKNRHAVPANVPPGQKLTPCWFYFLTAHALIHAGCVWVVSGSIGLALLELNIHWMIDHLKCENVTNPHIDQGLHAISKLLYVLLMGY